VPHDEIRVEAESGVDAKAVLRRAQQCGQPPRLAAAV
jgi:hypothetical protein